MLDVAAVKKEFPILERKVHDRRLVYLDSAASSQKPRSVLDAMTSYYETTHANVHRGVYTLAEEASAAYEGARSEIARFINAQSHHEVIFTKNATEAINLVAYSWGRHNLNAGDVVVLTEMEHHANLVPWHMLAAERGVELRFLPVRDDGYLDVEGAPALLAGAKLLSFSAASNVLGTLTPISELTEMAHAAGAIVLVDAAQYVPHRPTDVLALGVDFLAFTGHKMLGPTGIGVLWGKEELLDDMPPFLGGGDMIRDVTLEGFTPNELPWKFEAGTPPIAEVIGLGAAIRELERWGMDSISAHEEQLTRYALGALDEANIQYFGPTEALDRVGAISVHLDGAHPHDIAQVLDERGICVRAGHHCAKPLMRRLGVTATARASLYLYNDEDDVDELVDGLLEAKRMFA